MKIYDLSIDFGGKHNLKLGVKFLVWPNNMLPVRANSEDKNSHLPACEPAIPEFFESNLYTFNPNPKSA